MRETVERKAERLLATGCVRVVRVSSGEACAHVEGDHGEYVATRTRTADWRCSCLGYGFRKSCSHLRAVQLVVGGIA